MLPLVTIEGRVVADPALRFSGSGTAVTKMRLVASSRKKNPETQEWEDDKTLWIDCTCFKKLAENVAESVVKGDLVVVSGRLQTDQWETETGEKRSATTVIADAVAVSLAFRTVPAGGGRAERASTSAPPEDQSAAQADEPPF